jgi:hypothetical protein
VVAHYGDVRKVLRQLSLEESLPHIWQYSRLISGGIPLPDRYVHRDNRGLWQKLERYVFPHELDLLVREVLLHGDYWGTTPFKSLARWEDLADVINVLKNFGNNSFNADVDGGIWLTLHRLAHQQFPRFSRLTKPKMGRHLALYRSRKLREVLESTLGIDVDAYFIMAFAVIAGSLSNVRTNINTDYGIVGINPEQVERFFKLIVGSREEMRQMAIKSQKLDDCWEYAFNVFHYKPMIALNPKHPDRVYCPVPPALEKRVIEGLYYDLVSTNGFEHAFGEAVNEVIGRMLKSLEPAYEVYKPEVLTIRKQHFDGTDWVVQKGDNCAFVECKAKRISLSGRVAEEVQALRKELGTLAQAVVQNYANIHRAKQQDTEIGSTSKQYFNLVITLEDWLLFSEISYRLLHEQVLEKFAEAKLPLTMLDDVPYRVMGFEAAQHCCAALLDHPIDEVIGLTNQPKFAGMAFSHELRERFPTADAQAIGGFDADFIALLDPVIKRAGQKVAPV